VNDDSAPSGRPEDFVGTAGQFAEMARSLSSEPTIQATLQRIVDFAALNVDGCDGAGILLIHKREIVAGSWSDERVRVIETVECELGEGPCIDAIWQQPVFASADLREQESRWPRFIPRALAAGFESLLGFRLFAAADTIGALDLYGNRRGAFDETSRALGIVLASHAAIALAGAQIHEHDLDTITGLTEALVARDVIGQAKGILMAGRGIDADDAFALLSRTSQNQNVKVRVVAEQVAQTGELPEQE
jgi:transcriptional regulator with GAF, ATPase, and Fis domain